MNTVDAAKAIQVKKVVSISLGSSRRDAGGELRLGDTLVQLERRGTDGDLAKAAELLRFYDGKVDAIGLGGTDLYIVAGTRRYEFAQSRRLLNHVTKTPVVDGSGLKNTLERSLIRRLKQEYDLDLAAKKVLLVCAVDRFGMAEALEEQHCRLTFGDLIYGLGVDIPVHRLKTLSRLAAILVPVITKLPISWVYPTGYQQEKKTVRHAEYFREHDIIAGDFLLIRRFMPPRLEGKIIITNTVTAADREDLRKAGVRTLITTTPLIQGRSFGTNVLEAALVAAAGSPVELTPEEYEVCIRNYDLRPSIENLQ